MLQNRLFHGSLKFVRSFLTAAGAASRAPPHKQLTSVAVTLYSLTHKGLWPIRSLPCKGFNTQFPASRPTLQVQKQLVRTLSCSRPVCGIFSKGVNASDDKPLESNLIYTGPLSGMVKMVKLFSLTTSGLSMMILQFVFLSDQAAGMKALGSSMAVLLFLTPIALHWVSKSYVTKMYFNPDIDTYTAYTVGIFLKKVRHDFTPADVEVPAIRNLMTSILVKGRPMLLDPRAFTQPSHYSHMVGYDKLPDDISLEDIKQAMQNLAEEKQKD